MKKLPICYGIIPARYGSTRFPGKPLAKILGKPMFWHVFEGARQCPELSEVVLATDDNRIVSAAKKLDVPVVMTREDHANGTSRVLEAAEILQVPKDAVIVNIQGDEPTVNPTVLTELIRPFRAPDINVTTLARKIDLEEAKNPDRVKLVLAKSGRALYFSRSLIPHPHNGQDAEFYGHIGLYAFRMYILKRFVATGSSRLEITEKLEQLRFLENEIPVHTVVTEHRSISVDRPEDISTASKILMQKP